MTNLVHCYYSKNNLGNINHAMDVLTKYVKENNQMNENLTNIRYTVWAGLNVFRQNTANDDDKKFYSYSLQVNIITF